MTSPHIQKTITAASRYQALSPDVPKKSVNFVATFVTKVSSFAEILVTQVSADIASLMAGVVLMLKKITVFKQFTICYSMNRVQKPA